MVDSRELRTLRDRQEAARVALDRIGYASPGSAPMLVQVYQQTTIPTATGKFFAAHPVDPGGAEGEGNTPTFSADSGTVFVLVVGSRVPIAGDYLIAEPIDGRWVAESGRKKLGQCPLSMEESYTLTDEYFGITATITTTDGIDWNGCAVASWPGGTFIMMPGVFEVIPPCAVGLNYRMRYATFAAGPSLQITYKLPNDYVVGDSLVPGASGCGGTPTPSHTLGAAEITRVSWNCPPGFQAVYGLAAGALYLSSIISPGERIRIG